MAAAVGAIVAGLVGLVKLAAYLLKKWFPVLTRQMPENTVALVIVAVVLFVVSILALLLS